MTRLRVLSSLLVRLLVAMLPWPARRFALTRLFGYRFGRGARIAWLSWVYPRSLEMGDEASIALFTVVIHLENLRMGEKASIGRGNWITGHPRGRTPHFRHRLDRDPSLYLGQHSAITKSHLIDCTDTVRIGDFSTIAGYRSQILTHAIDLHAGRQDCWPIHVGDYCFVGTGSVLLCGARLPNASVLGALSLLHKAYDEPYTLYAGNPARPLKSIDPAGAYFRRETGFVE